MTTKELKEKIKIDLRETRERIVDYIFNNERTEVTTITKEHGVRKHFYKLDKEDNLYYIGNQNAYFE